MSTWRLARSLAVFRDEVNRRAPRRSKASDGTIGDPSHASRTSDHNPNQAGVVRAMDITDDPAGGLDAAVLARQVAELLGHHPALGSGAYVIWNRRIISTSRLGEGWRRYDGANPHNHHMHVSVGTRNYDNTTPWIKENDMALDAADMRKIRKEFAAELVAIRNTEVRTRDGLALVFAKLGVAQADIDAIEAALIKEGQ